MPVCARCGASFPEPSLFCPMCGAPQAAAPPAPMPYPAPPYYVPPRKDNTVLIVVVIVIVVVLLVALPAVLYVMVSGLLTGPSTPKPFVTFSTPQLISNATYQFSITAASTAVAPADYKMNFGIGSVPGTAASFPQVSSVPAYVFVGSVAVSITWQDLGSDGLVSSGDVLTISLGSAVAAGTSLAFYLLWSDGSDVQTVTWQALVFAKPVVVFSNLTRVNSTAESFSVASASPAVAPTNYKWNIQIGTTLGTAGSFPTTSGLSTSQAVGSTTITVKWQDVGGDGVVNAGDLMYVTWSGTAPATGTTVTFYLLYSDGSQIQTEAWQV